MSLPVPSTAAGVAGLAALLERPRQALLAFDYDGVLSPIVEDPRQARPFPRTMSALSRLASQVGSIAVITGRPVDVVVAYGGFAKLPALSGLVVYGSYGRERWEASSGEVVVPPPSAAVESARADLPRLLVRVGAGDVWLEDKGSALAVHTRRSQDPHATLALLQAPLAEFAADHDLIIEPGRLVLELRPPGADKGSALRAHVLARSAASVAYAGDDLGDLPAFAAIDALRDEGLAGLKICSGSAENEGVARNADLVVDGPAGIADLLESLLAVMLDPNTASG